VLRARMAASLHSISAEAQAAAGDLVCERVAALPEFVGAARVVAYAALASELPTAPLVARAVALGKELLWPRIGRDGRLEIAPAGFEELLPSERGFLTPPAERIAVRLRSGDLLLAPALAYTKTGARLGRGGGHYDQLIAENPGVVTVGIAFDIQLVHELPLEPHDRRVDLVITPSGVWRTK